MAETIVFHVHDRCCPTSVCAARLLNRTRRGETARSARQGTPAVQPARPEVGAFYRIARPLASRKMVCGCPLRRKQQASRGRTARCLGLRAPPPRPCPGANLPPIPSGGVHASLYSFELGKIEGLRRRVNGSSGRWQVLDSRRAIHARVVARAPSLRADRCSPLFSSACSPFRVFAMSFPRGSHDVRVEGI